MSWRFSYFLPLIRAEYKSAIGFFASLHTASFSPALVYLCPAFSTAQMQPLAFCALLRAKQCNIHEKLEGL